MATTQSRKRKSDAMAEDVETVTPSGSPAPKRMKITETQKQALIDNLQLEVTERARHLRAHYALQCADLRARIERRVNRIPVAMRKMTMGELMAKHAAPTTNTVQTAAPTKQPSTISTKTLQEKQLPSLPSQIPTKTASPVRVPVQLPTSRSNKRKTSDINIVSDKENEGPVEVDSLPVPKNNKRAKTVATARTTSRTGKPTSVLSPRSHNSRTLPRSPIKEFTAAPASPTKSTFTRPTSPLKPPSPFKSAATAATSAISASMHGFLEGAKRGTAATAGKLSRTASREKAIGSNDAATTTKGKMLPPPRPISTAPSSPQRTVSQSSNHSSTTDVSTVSTTTVIQKSKRGRTAKLNIANTTTKARTAKKEIPAPSIVAITSPVAASSVQEKEIVSPAPSVTRKKGTAATAAAKAATAAKSALKKTTGTTAAKEKKAAATVIIAEPAAGKRVLRKRN